MLPGGARPAPVLSLRHSSAITVGWTRTISQPRRRCSTSAGLAMTHRRPKSRHGTPCRWNSCISTAWSWSWRATLPTIPTACDILDYKPPPGVPRDSLTDHPVVVTNPDGSVTYDFFQSIARLDLARANPSRRAELRLEIPDPAATLFDVAAFEESKAASWGHVCASAFNHLDTLKDTADFKASELIRLLYLAGELPEHLRSTTAHWRNAGDFERDVNLPFKVEARITKPCWSSSSGWTIRSSSMERFTTAIGVGDQGEAALRCDGEVAPTQPRGRREGGQRRDRRRRKTGGDDLLVGKPPAPVRKRRIPGGPVAAG